MRSKRSSLCPVARLAASARGRTDPKGKTERLRQLVARWAEPQPFHAPLIAAGLFRRELVEILLHFPLFQKHTIFTQNQEIWRVKMALELLASLVEILKFKGMRLIVKFEDRIILLHQIDRTQLK
jgi:hypothetical protein